MIGVWYKYAKCNKTVGSQCSAPVQWHDQHSATVQPWQWVFLYCDWSWSRVVIKHKRNHSALISVNIRIFLHRHCIAAERGGCFRQNLFVCGFVCSFVCLFVNKITSERSNIGWRNLIVGALYKNLGLVWISGHRPNFGGPHHQNVANLLFRKM